MPETAPTQATGETFASGYPGADERGPPLLRRSNEAVTGQAYFVGNPISRQVFASNHPLSFPRVGAVMGLCEALGWWDRDEFRLAPEADFDTLCRFHDSTYVHALHDADRAGRVSIEIRQRHRIGTAENPLFAGVFRRAATAVGGSILAARIAMDSGLAFHPAGGTHHGMRDRAHGFCYFNDPAFAIQTLLDGGRDRVLYVDLDAHHGDGVQQAFLDEPGVLCISIHEQGRWPYSGALDDRGNGYARNFPVPRGFHDAELAYLMEHAVLPLAEEFAPMATVITCGTDALAGDPLSRMALGNASLWQAVDQLRALTGATVVLGGGGYNPWTLARCWTGLWARLSGRAIPHPLPEPARHILRQLRSELVDEDDILPGWLDSLADAQGREPVRAEIRALVRGLA